MRKVLVALDASDDRIAVGNLVKEVTSNRPNVMVTLLHVAAPVPADVRQEVARLDREVGLDVNIDTLVDRQGTEILRPVEQMLKEAGIPVEMEITVGDPGPEICRVAKSGGYYMVIMGRRGLSRIKEAFLGSVTEYVLRNSEIPVLIVQFPKVGAAKKG